MVEPDGLIPNLFFPVIIECLHMCGDTVLPLVGVLINAGIVDCAELLIIVSTNQLYKCVQIVVVMPSLVSASFSRYSVGLVLTYCGNQHLVGSCRESKVVFY